MIWPLLRTRRWLAFTGVVIATIVAFGLLSHWQWARADVRRRTAAEHRSATHAGRDVRRRHPEAGRSAGPTRRRPPCRRVIVAHHRDDLARAIDEHERERLTATLRTKDYLYRAGAESIEEERIVGGVHGVGRVGGGTGGRLCSHRASEVKSDDEGRLCAGSGTRAP